MQAPRGTKDLFGEEVRLFQFLEDTGRRLFTLYGYSELRTPIFECSEVFVRSIGEASDIVTKEMFTFEDRKGRSLTLRPEATAPIVRALLEHHLFTQRQVWKVYYLGPMFRYERPQHGRQRQFHQIGVEFFGVAEPHADAEIIMLAVRYMGEVGFKKVHTQLNSVGCFSCRPEYTRLLREFLQQEAGSLCRDCQHRAQLNPMRVFDCKHARCQQLLARAPQVREHLCSSCENHLQQLKNLLRERQVSFEENPRLVRGFDYYTRTVFEITIDVLGAQDAVLGGGRYDRLVKEFGGPDIPGIGFSFGTERLVLALQKLKISPPQARQPFLYAILLDEEERSVMLEVLESVRAQNIAAFFDYRVRSVKSGLRAANRVGATHALILGSEERQRDSVTIKALTSSQQSLVLLQELPAFLKELRI